MPVRACAACDCGDPTLTVMGAEKPFSGRLRASAELRVLGLALGRAGDNREEIHDERVDLGVAYAPIPSLFLSLTVPLVRRETEYVNLGRDQVTGLGEIELRAKLFLWSDRHFSPRHLLAAVGGVKLPTAPRMSGDGGRTIPVDAQAGTGSTDLIAGLSYGAFFAPWSLYASATVSVPSRGWDTEKPGASLRSTVAGQVQPRNDIAIQLGVDTRLDAVSHLGSAVEPDSGGWIAFVTPRFVYAPATDLLVHVAVAIPVIDQLKGDHREDPIVSVGAAYDF